MSNIPRNGVTGEAYAGKNVERLLGAAAENDWPSNTWAGYKQWLDRGRVVRKGEHGTTCVRVIVVTDDTGKETTRVRGFRVFALEQTVELELAAQAAEPAEPRPGLQWRSVHFA